MEIDVKNDVKLDFFSQIKKIHDIAEQARGLDDLFYEFAEPHLKFLSKHLNISIVGTALLAILVYIYNGDKIKISKFAKYLECPLIEVIAYFDELEILEQKGLIHIIRDDEDFRSYDRGEIAFELRFNTINELRKGNFIDPDSIKNLSINEFFRHLEHLCEERVQHRISYNNTKMVMQNLLRNNEHLVFVKKIQKLSLPDDALIIYLRFFSYLINLDEPEMGFYELGGLYDNHSEFSEIKMKLKNGKHILIENGLIENSCCDGFGSTEIFRLTDFSKEEFLIEVDFKIWNVSPKDLKKADSIVIKNLYYPNKTQQAIDELCSLLKQENFKDIQKRLSQNGMRQGFACLFLGGPGTGKTETVYQIARMTGRDIMHVDISNTKSKWFGDSEKQIKGIFDKYCSYAKRSIIAPILFLNEADAVLGKRRMLDGNRNGPDQTENAIQNIILSEMENLSGILIATTNLQKNFDDAFERRFLYKIEFAKPDSINRKSIWGSMISDLSDEDALYLASQYDFSGGQIENISRKITINQVLSGNPMSLKDIIRFCNNENYVKETASIGFCINS